MTLHDARHWLGKYVRYIVRHTDVDESGYVDECSRSNRSSFVCTVVVETTDGGECSWDVQVRWNSRGYLRIARHSAISCS
jgi:hypothetical protein